MGSKVIYTPCAKVIHYGSQSINQMPRKKIVELHRALADFSDVYDDFDKRWLVKKLIRVAVGVRCCLKLLEFHFGSDKRVIKGPGAPPLNLRLRNNATIWGNRLAHHLLTRNPFRGIGLTMSNIKVS